MVHRSTFIAVVVFAAVVAAQQHGFFSYRVSFNISSGDGIHYMLSAFNFDGGNPQSVTAYYQNGGSEDASALIDRDPNTDWGNDLGDYASVVFLYPCPSYGSYTIFTSYTAGRSVLHPEKAPTGWLIEFSYGNQPYTTMSQRNRVDWETDNQKSFGMTYCPATYPSDSDSEPGTCSVDHEIGETCSWTCSTSSSKGTYPVTGTCKADGTWTGLSISCGGRSVNTLAVALGTVLPLVFIFFFISLFVVLTVMKRRNLRNRKPYVAPQQAKGQGGSAVLHMSPADRMALASVSEARSEDGEGDTEATNFLNALDAFARTTPPDMALSRELAAEFAGVTQDPMYRGVMTPAGTTQVLSLLRSCMVASSRLFALDHENKILIHQAKSWLFIDRIGRLTLRGGKVGLRLLNAKGLPPIDPNVAMAFASVVNNLALATFEVINKLTTLEGVFESLGSIQTAGPDTMRKGFMDLEPQFQKALPFVAALAIPPAELSIKGGVSDEDSWDRAGLPRQLLNMAGGFDKLRDHVKTTPFRSLQAFSDHLKGCGVVLGAVATEISLHRQQTYIFFPLMSAEGALTEIDTGSFSQTSSKAGLPGPVIMTSDLTIYKEYGTPNQVSSAQAHFKGMAVVFHAIKVPFNNDQRTRFNGLIATLRLLRHPFLIHTLGSTGAAEPSYISEYVPHARSLASKLEEGHTPWATRQVFALAIARGLAFLHNCKPPIVHGALNSSNVIVSQEGRPLIVHAGLAGLGVYDTDKYWCAPELRGKTPFMPTVKGDVYSYGTLTLELAGNFNANASRSDSDIDSKTAHRAKSLGILWCQDQDPAKRKPMPTIIAKLEGTLSSASSTGSEESEEASGSASVSGSDVGPLNVPFVMPLKVNLNVSGYSGSGSDSDRSRKSKKSSKGKGKGKSSKKSSKGKSKHSKKHRHSYSDEESEESYHSHKHKHSKGKGKGKGKSSKGKGKGKHHK